MKVSHGWSFPRDLRYRLFRLSVALTLDSMSEKKGQKKAYRFISIVMST